MAIKRQRKKSSKERLAHEIRMVKENKAFYFDKVKEYYRTYFEGRIMTNEIRGAKRESLRLARTLSVLQKEYKRHA